ncbi:ferredoxin fas2 [mine drainage metagenome]|uniref:Ferredoxin fas2 n=1 Tax=mine drainage metagenome TaxID=410659 RepID=A0A1J5SI32_9ZZZZ
MTDHDLALKSLAYRKGILRWIKHAGAGHTGGDLSCIDILNVLYNRILRVSPDTRLDPSRDRYIQSKGHCVEALYVVLADRGYFPESDLETLCGYQSHYVGHPTRKIPGVEQNTGALGHGLPIAVGTALGGRLDGASFRVFTLMGDGELAEGSNWEAALAAAHYRLDNLTAIVDLNTLQISGRTRDVMNHEPLAEKWASFGWAVRTVDGHDFAALTAALEKPLEPGKPSMVIARTLKGKGVSFMQDVAKWHHGVPSDDEYARALAELDAQVLSLGEAAR